MLKTHDFYYDLPEELIAQTPLERRDGSRLMVLSKNTGEIEHRHFYDLPEYLQPGDTLVLNDSRVLPARLLGHRVPTMGAVEVLLLRDKGDGVWECLTKPGRKTHTGTELSFGDDELTATVVGEVDDGNKLVQFHYKGISSRCWSVWGRCRCRRISMSSCKTPSAIRPSIPEPTALPPRRRLGCISRRSFWKSCRHRA